MSQRRVATRPYLFEILVLANVLIVLMMGRDAALGVILPIFRSTIVSTTGCLIAGVAIRLGIAAFRGRARTLLRIYSSAGWLTDTVRIFLMQLFLTFVYLWIKLTIPIYHPRLFDRELWAIDSALLFGHSPNILLLNLFSIDWFLRFVDITYAGVFLGSMLIALTVFLSWPDRRIRVAFMTSNVVLWLSGTWLYLAIPSLGPAYRFAEVWYPYTDQLRANLRLQAALLDNYRKVVWSMSHGGVAFANVLYGVAAFPSLHVGWQTLIFLWFRRVWKFGAIVFGLCTLFIFLGAVITGWHYMIDSIAGIVLAVIAYTVTALPARIPHAVALRKKVAA